MTKTEFDGAIVALTAAITNLTTQVTTLSNNNRINLNRGGDRGNNHMVDDSNSEEEEVVTEERNDRGNHHDYRVKADIPLFYGTMGVEEFLDWQIDVDRFFDVMDVDDSCHFYIFKIISMVF